MKKNKNNIKDLSVQEQIAELSKVDLSILDNDHKSYAETGYLKVFEVSIKKGLVSPWKAIIEGFLGGFFIAMGYIGTLFATSGMADSELKTLAPFITGFVFTIAILCITFIGGSLFTSNCMGLLPVVKGNLTGKKYVSRLFLVLLGNYIGTLFAAIIVFLMGSLSKKNNTLYEGVSALFAHKVGELGVTNPNPSFKDFVIVFVHNFASAIWCNIVIGATLWFTYSFKDATATILGCFFGILVFGISGFQHVVANSFPLFAAMFLMPQGDIHPQAYLYFVSDNLIPAGIGNWIAGALILPFATNVLFKQQGNALSVKLKLQELKAQIEKKV